MAEVGRASVIVALERQTYVSCFSHNLTIVNKEPIRCGKSPFVLPSNVSFAVSNMKYTYRAETLSLNSLSGTKIQFIDAPVDAETRMHMDLISKGINGMSDEAKEQNRFAKLINAAHSSASENPVTSCGIIFVLVFLPLSAIIYFCCCRRNRVVEMIETQILANVAENSSRSSKFNQQGVIATPTCSGSMPNITISVGNTLVQSDASEFDNNLDVNSIGYPFNRDLIGAARKISFKPPSVGERKDIVRILRAPTPANTNLISLDEISRSLVSLASSKFKWPSVPILSQNSGLQSFKWPSSDSVEKVSQVESLLSEP